MERLYQRTNDVLWKAQIELIHVINPRRKAIQLARRVYETRYSGGEFIEEVDELLHEAKKREEDGIQITGTLCQLTKNTIEFNHGRGLPFNCDPPTAARGFGFWFNLNERHFLSVLLDTDRSRIYYDVMNKSERMKFWRGTTSAYREKVKTDTPIFLALLSETQQGFRIEEFSAVKNVYPTK